MLKTLLVLVIVLVSYMTLYSDATKYLEVPPIEIKNECEIELETNNLCKRSFTASSYAEKININFEGVSKNQTLVGKLSGLTPDLLSYTVSLDDESFVKLWRHESSEIIRDIQPGICPYPSNYKETQTGGYFEDSVGLLEIPSQLSELAIALNDCQQWALVLPKDVNDFERTEKYNIHIKLSTWSYLTLFILSLLFTALVLGAVKFLFEFIRPGLWNRKDK